jgi:hypothetical protein
VVPSVNLAGVLVLFCYCPRRQRATQTTLFVLLPARQQSRGLTRELLAEATGSGIEVLNRTKGRVSEVAIECNC